MKIISRIINRRFRDEGCMLKAAIVQQRSKYLQSQFAAAYVLVTIQPRSALGLSVITMPHANVFQTHRFRKMLQRELAAFVTDDVISGNVSVAGIDARAHGHGVAKKLQQLRNLLKSAAQRIFRTRRVFDQDR